MCVASNELQTKDSNGSNGVNSNSIPSITIDSNRMKFPYAGWFNLRGNKGKKRVQAMFDATYRDEVIAIIIGIWVAWIVWSIT